MPAMTRVREPRYSPEPAEPENYTMANNRAYSRFARLYDVVVKVAPLWRSWLRPAIGAIEGPRVLEVSPGTGWLLTQYADRFDTVAIDLNPTLLAVTRDNLARAGVRASLQQGRVEALPYRDGVFDTVVNTMAFTGYPDGRRALAELARVLRPGGRLVIIDIGLPRDRTRRGTWLLGVWKRAGDIVRDMPALLTGAGFAVIDDEVGGWGTVHRYVATKPVQRVDDAQREERM